MWSFCGFAAKFTLPVGYRIPQEGEFDYISCKWLVSPGDYKKKGSLFLKACKLKSPPPRTPAEELPRTWQSCPHTYTQEAHGFRATWKRTRNRQQNHTCKHLWDFERINMVNKELSPMCLKKKWFKDSSLYFPNSCMSQLLGQYEVTAKNPDSCSCNRGHPNERFKEC